MSDTLTRPNYTFGRHALSEAEIVSISSRLFIGRRQTFAGYTLYAWQRGANCDTVSATSRRSGRSCSYRKRRRSVPAWSFVVFEMCSSLGQGLRLLLYVPLSRTRWHSSSSAVSSWSAMAYGDDGRVLEDRAQPQRRNSAVVTASGGQLQSGERKDARLPFQVCIL
jgi:hypothetical protein